MDQQDLSNPTPLLVVPSLCLPTQQGMFIRVG